MKLYGFPPSPNTWKVRAVAAHLGVPLQFELVDLNPTGRTPVLVDGDFILWESNAILQYLASRAANALWPDDMRTRTDIMRWQSWQLAHWHQEACVPLIWERLIKSIARLGPPDAAVVAKATEAFNREAKVLDVHLAKNAYLVGTAITLADFSVAAPLFYVKEAELPVGGHPHLEEWFARVSALPAWRDTAPVWAASVAA